MSGPARVMAVLLLLAAPLALAGEATVRRVPVAEAGYAPYLRYAPAGGASRLDWLLVAPRDLLTAFAPLVEHRRDVGLEADAVALEDVQADVLLGGSDLPERLRNLVRRLHRRYGLRYLVLGADSSVLPSRMVPFGIQGRKVHYGEPFAGDAYFGCLDGEWNRDADARFGEAEAGDDDQPDVQHEVHVGRVPVESVREAETWVAKCLAYERPRHLDYQHRVVYLGGKVFVEDDADRFYRSLHEEAFGLRGFEPSWFTREADEIPAKTVLDALSRGVGVVCHFHHSFTYNLSLSQGAIDTGNYAEITNAERPFVMFSNGCYSNQFTKEGISEKLVLSAAGGPVAFIGSTNTCFTSSLHLERGFWEVLFGDRASSLGEALSLVRGNVSAGMGVMGFLRLSFSLLGDPATRPWLGKVVRYDFEARATKDGAVRVTLARRAPGRTWVACRQPGPWGARRASVLVPEGARTVDLPPVVGNGAPLRITVHGERLAPATREVPDPVAVRVTRVRAEGGRLLIALDGADDLAVDLPALEPGPFRVERDVEDVPLVLAVPVLDGADPAFVQGDEIVRYPGLARLGAPRPDGLPLVTVADAPPVACERSDARLADLAPDVVATADTVRVSWRGEVGARWLVAEGRGKDRRLLTPVPLVNPVYERAGLPPLTRLQLHVYRLGRPNAVQIEASTSFAAQVGFPQKIGANITSVQLLDLDGKRGREVVFGDDRLGLWALKADGSEVRHAGDAWTFGLFAAVEGGVFEPVVADIAGSRKPEIIATGKLKDRKLHAFHSDGTSVAGFPVAFPSRLMTPPLVGDFDGKRGNEILVVSGFGKTIEMVRGDGTRTPFAEIGQYNYGYPVAVNLDRDRALEVVVVDGQGKVWSFEGDGTVRTGFPVDLGGPGRATPVVANLDRDRALEIVAVGKGTTRLAVIDGKTGAVQADLLIPDAGAPANYSHFYPGLARLAPKAPLSILVGTPSKKLFAFDLADGERLELHPGYPLDLPAEARGIVAVDVDGDGADELFLSLHDGQVWGLEPDGTPLPGFPLRTRADTYAVPLLEDLDGDRDLELFLGAADGTLRVWDLPYRVGRKAPTWAGLLGGSGMPGRPASTAR